VLPFASSGIATAGRIIKGVWIGRVAVLAYSTDAIDSTIGWHAGVLVRGSFTSTFIYTCTCVGNGIATANIPLHTVVSNNTAITDACFEVFRELIIMGTTIIEHHTASEILIIRNGSRFHTVARVFVIAHVHNLIRHYVVATISRVFSGMLSF